MGIDIDEKYVKLSKQKEKYRKKDEPEKEFSCLNCGRVLTNKGNYLYYRRFCSEQCLEEYKSSAEF